VQKILFCVMCLILFVGCQSAGRAVVPDIGDGVNQARNDIADLAAGQTNLALAGERIEDHSAGLASGIDELEQSIISGTDENAVLEEIIRAVRNRPIDASQ